MNFDFLVEVPWTSCIYDMPRTLNLSCTWFQNQVIFINPLNVETGIFRTNSAINADGLALFVVRTSATGIKLTMQDKQSPFFHREELQPLALSQCSEMMKDAYHIFIHRKIRSARQWLQFLTRAKVENICQLQLVQVPSRSEFWWRKLHRRSRNIPHSNTSQWLFRPGVGNVARQARILRVHERNQTLFQYRRKLNILSLRGYRAHGKIKTVSYQHIVNTKNSWTHASTNLLSSCPIVAFPLVDLLLLTEDKGSRVFRYLGHSKNKTDDGIKQNVWAEH